MYFPAVGRFGVASRLYTATLYGIDVLRRGGNVFDAAITISSILSLLIPHTGGLGGDAFILGRLSNGEVVCYNGSGRSPKEFPVDFFISSRPRRGGLTISVPGLVDTWIYINENYGSMDLYELLKPSISLAENGFYPPKQTVSAINFYRDELSVYRSWRDTYGELKGGEPIKLKKFGYVLKMVARRGWDGFYTGEIAESIVEDLRSEGSPITVEDFESHRGEEVEPLKIDYRGLTLYEHPPNTQGVTTLQILRMADEIGLNDMSRDMGWWDTYMKISALAYMDRDRFIGDPEYMDVDPYQLLSREHVSSYTDLLKLGEGDTTFFTLSDKYGNILGFIQSLFHPFGSGLVSHEIPFQNRLIGFKYEKGYPNSPGPGKRPLHTLSVLMAESEEAYYIIGCAGGDLRPQIHSQVLMNIVDYGMDISNAVMNRRNMLIKWMDGKPVEAVFEDEYDISYATRLKYPSRRVGVVQALKYKPNTGYTEVFADVRGGGTHIAVDI